MHGGCMTVARVQVRGVIRYAVGVHRWLGNECSTWVGMVSDAAGLHPSACTSHTHRHAREPTISVKAPSQRIKSLLPCRVPQLHGDALVARLEFLHHAVHSHSGLGLSPRTWTAVWL